MTAALVLVLSWTAGFILFTWHATRPPGPAPRADGIVVLTGGTSRIEVALGLLAADRARMLLISGVNPNLDLTRLMHAAGLDLGMSGQAAHPPGVNALRDRITLGHAATTTFGNATETAAWAHANGLHSLIVVTAGYHMQRALAEIAIALPEVSLRPYPVLPPALQRLASFGTLRLLVSEYDKWLLVASGLTGAAHLREIQ